MRKPSSVFRLTLLLVCGSLLAGACGRSGTNLGEGDGAGGSTGDGDASGGMTGDGDASGGMTGDGDGVGGITGDGDGDLGGTAGQGGMGGVVDEPTPIELVQESIEFLGYGLLRIQFNLPVDLGSLEAALSPAAPAVFGVKEVTLVDEATIDIQFDQAHLPRDYTLTISGVGEEEGTPFELEALVSGEGNGSRVMFITKETGFGDLRAWEGAAEDADDGLAAADSICQSEADAAGLSGTFISYLSATDLSVICRLQGLEGTVTNKCGQESMPSVSMPILNTHGLPVAFGSNEMAVSDFRTVLNYYADSTVVGTNRRVAHGTNDIGDPSINCDDWETASISSSYFGGNPPAMYRVGPKVAPNCMDEMHIACIQVGGPFFEEVSAHQRTGKQAFVSSTLLDGMMIYGEEEGVAAADLLCQDEAEDAGLPNFGNFRAYLSTASDDALCRILGATGTVTDQCGLGVLPDVSWVSVDGYPVGTPATLPANPDSILAVMADGGLVGTYDGTHVWTGTLGDGTADSNCSDFMSDAGTGATGSLDAIGSSWTRFSIPGCTADYRVYGFEN